jgi:hypothetical protein
VISEIRPRSFQPAISAQFSTGVDSLLDRAGVVVECSTHSQHRHAQQIAIFVGEDLLPRTSESYKRDAGPRPSNSARYLGLLTGCGVADHRRAGTSAFKAGRPYLVMRDWSLEGVGSAPSELHGARDSARRLLNRKQVRLVVDTLVVPRNMKTTRSRDSPGRPSFVKDRRLAFTCSFDESSRPGSKKGVRPSEGRLSCSRSSRFHDIMSRAANAHRPRNPHDQFRSLRRSRLAPSALCEFYEGSWGSRPAALSSDSIHR